MAETGLNIAGAEEVFEPTGTATESQSSGYAGYAAAITTATNVLSGFAETSAFKDSLKANREADIANVKNLTTSYEISYVKNVEAIDSINSALGDKLSERGLQAMKEAALLKVAAAETGSSGGTTDFAIQEAFLNENFDMANMTAANEQQIKNVFIGMESEENRVRNQIDSTLLGGGVSVNTNPWLAGVQGGLNVGMSTFALLPESDRVLAFGVKPKDV